MRMVAYALLSQTITLIGSCSCTAVVSSWPVIRKPPSPTNATTGRSGLASLAPIAAGTAYPLAPELGAAWGAGRVKRWERWAERRRQRGERDTGISRDRRVSAPTREDRRVRVDVNQALVCPKERELLGRDVVEAAPSRDDHIALFPRLALELSAPRAEVPDVRLMVIRKGILAAPRGRYASA